MEEILKFALLGLGTGALYALAAQGMVLIYRGSGVINFAHGAMALLSAAVFVELRNDWQLPLILSITIAVGCSAFTGFLLDFAIMRRIRHASPLARLVVTLGVLGIIESIVIVRYGSGLRFVDQYLPDAPIQLAGVSLSADRLLLCVIAAIITALLWALYRFTEFGKQTTAVAENPRSAAAMGISPNAISQLNWTMGCALAGLAGVLIVPITGLMAVTMVLLINPILASALVGRFSSFPLTLLGGLFIGIAQSLINYADMGTGWSSAIPFLVIIVLLIARGQALPLRDFLADKLPAVGAAKRLGITFWALLLITVVLIATVNEDILAAITSSMLTAIILLSIVVLTGMAGQVSLGQYAFAGIGAFVAARLADLYGLPFALCFAAAITVAVPVGLLFSIPALRTRGINLAIATLGLGLGLDALLFKNKDYTGGFTGTQVDPPQLLGLSFDSIMHPQRYAALVLTILVCGIWMTSNLRRNPSGRRLLAVRGDERAASAMGVSVVKVKLYAFSVAAALAAAGGAVAAFRYPNVRFDSGYSAFESIPAVLMTFLGGIGFIGGAIIGGLLSVGGLINELMSAVIELNEWQGLAIGIGAIAMVIAHPDGLAMLFNRKKTSSALLPLSPKHSASNTTAAQAAVVPDLAAANLVPSNLTAPNSVTAKQNKTLQIKNLTVKFGGVVAVNDLSFSVQAKQITGLIGPNGAGKTTLLDTVSGFTTPTTGQVLLGDQDISQYSPAKRAQQGLARSFQNLALFNDLTVAEHLLCAYDQNQKYHPFKDLILAKKPALPDTALHIAKIFSLDQHLHCLPSQLSFGQRRLLGIARAAASNPSVLLLDEPAAGLDSTETLKLGALIKTLANQWGLTILLVEHDMNLVMNYCDHVVVMDFGHKLASGKPDAVSRDPAVINAYLGGDDKSAGSSINHKEPSQ